MKTTSSSAFCTARSIAAVQSSRSGCVQDAGSIRIAPGSQPGFPDRLPVAGVGAVPAGNDDVLHCGWSSSVGPAVILPESLPRLVRY